MKIDKIEFSVKAHLEDGVLKIDKMKFNPKELSLTFWVYLLSFLANQGALELNEMLRKKFGGEE